MQVGQLRRAEGDTPCPGLPRERQPGDGLCDSSLQLQHDPGSDSCNGCSATSQKHLLAPDLHYKVLESDFEEGF